MAFRERGRERDREKCGRQEIIDWLPPPHTYAQANTLSTEPYQPGHTLKGFKRKKGR